MSVEPGHEDPTCPEQYRGLGYHELNALLNLYDCLLYTSDAADE